MSNHFAEALLLSPRGRAYFAREARGTSGSMVKIERTILSGFPMALPCREEQDAILGSLDRLSTQRDTELRRLAELKRLKVALARALLTGRIRTNAVPTAQVQL